MHNGRETRDVVACLYRFVQHMLNTYDNGARLCNAGLHANLMQLGKMDISVAFLALKKP